MSERGREGMRYGSSSDVNGKTTPLHDKRSGSRRVASAISIRYDVEDRSMGQPRKRSSEYSGVRFLQRLRDKMSGALCHALSLHRRRRPSPKVSSSKPSVAPPSDFHRTQAIEDCIHFINSSSLKKPDTVTANSS